MADEPLLIFFRLAKAGYGSLHEVQQFNAREILQALHYETFVGNWEAAYLELNKDK